MPTLKRAKAIGARAAQERPPITDSFLLFRCRRPADNARLAKKLPNSARLTSFVHRSTNSVPPIYD